MKNNQFIKSELIKVAFTHIHPLISSSLLEDIDFREEYGYMADPILTFKELDVSFQSSNLFKSVQKMFAGSSTEVVTDTIGKKWKLKYIDEDGELPRLALHYDEQTLILPDLGTLHQKRSFRIRSLEEIVLDVCLPANTKEVWKIILNERTFDGQEVDDFLGDVRDTPIFTARTMHGELRKGEGTISTLVPKSKRYFHRLIGEYDDSASVHDYAVGTCKYLFNQLVEWKPYDGLLLCLLVSSHSSITKEICVDRINSEDLVKAYEFLDQHGDRVSQLGAVEVGLRILPSRPEIEPLLIRLIEQIRDDDVDGASSGFRLLSALYLLVDGELSKYRIMADEPPFYRRLAALSQAALIHRQLLTAAVDIDQFREWVTNNFGEQFFMQSLSDMRLEPRWSPNLAMAAQMKQDYLGRIMIASSKYEENIQGSEFTDLVLGKGPDSIFSKSEFPWPFFPGPLEGADNNINSLPNGFSEIIEKQLRDDKVSPSSFSALVNSALIYGVVPSHADLAAEVISLGNYTLSNVEDKHQLIATLNGLATVAAVTRNHMLADKLRILVRRYNQDEQYSLSVDESLMVGLVAAASRVDLTEWTEYVGDWLTEMAFSKFKGNDGEVLHSHMLCLCHAVPELWIFCGRAEAALMAYNNI